MRTITLSLTTLAGDELGRLPLTTVVAATAGEPAATAQVLPRRAQITTLLASLDAALSSQGLRPAQSPAERALAVTLALALDEEIGDILIPVSVHTPTPLPAAARAEAVAAETNAPSATELEKDVPTGLSIAINWADLLRPDSTEENTDHA